MATSCGTVRLVAGPQGNPGTSGTDGADGASAFALLTSQFTMPAELATASAVVSDTSWMTPGNIYYLQGAGWLLATAIVDSTHVTLQNLEDTASGAYTDNVAAGTVIAVSNKLVAAGLQGPDGAAAGGAFLVANNLSEGVAATMRTNLGLGTIATQAASAVAITGGTIAGITDLAIADGGTGSSTAAGARTNLGLGTMATQAASAVAITGGAITGITDLAVADGGTGASTAADARTNLGIVSGYGLLGSVTTWDLNSATTDTAFTISSARYIIDKITVENASVNLTTATGGVFTAAGGAGTTIAADQALSALTASTKFDDLTLQAITGTDVFTAGTLYARVGSAQGAAATATLRVYGYKLD
jgi:hypothetical protein